MQELSTDDTACTENLGNFAIVEGPAVFLASSFHLSETLGIADNLREIEGLTHGFNDVFFICFR